MWLVQIEVRDNVKYTMNIGGAVQERNMKESHMNDILN